MTNATSRRGAAALVAALALALVGALLVGFGVQGAAAADLDSETFVPDNETEGYQVTVENTTGTLNVTVEGLENSTGNWTEVANGTLEATSADATDQYEFRDVNSSAYDEYRITVSGDAAETVIIAELSGSSGGGGFLPSGQSAQLLTVVVLLAIGAALAMGYDP
ncbi:hypothetical protein ACKVMT_10255 [Halobacteriales archaeon Cl-PHB]